MAKSRSSSRNRRQRLPGETTSTELLQESSRKTVPSVVVLSGNSTFLRQATERHIFRVLFGADQQRSLTAYQRFDAAQRHGNLCAEVLDELRTVSIISPERLVAVDNADPFLSEHREILEPFVERGFAGGHLILHLTNPLDMRTRFAKAVGEHGLAVDCKQPFDRPPPWETRSAPWENDLARWVVAWAKKKRLEIDLKTAFELHERVGNNLGTLDESLEKLATFLGSEQRKVDLKAVEAVTGEIRADSLFDLVEAFVTRRRARALRMAERILGAGYHPPKSSPIYDPGAITIMFIGALVKRLKPLRRAHAMRSLGRGPEDWLAERLTSRPFIERFRQELEAMQPDRIERTYAALYTLDRSIKKGANARLGLLILLAQE